MKKPVEALPLQSTSTATPLSTRPMVSPSNCHDYHAELYADNVPHTDDDDDDDECAFTFLDPPQRRTLTNGGDLLIIHDYDSRCRG